MKIRKIGELILICSILLLQTTGLSMDADADEQEVNFNDANVDTIVFYKYSIIWGICDFIEIRIGGYGVPRVNAHITHGFMIGLKGNPVNHDNMSLGFTHLNNATVNWLWDGQNLHGFYFPPCPSLSRHFLCYLTFHCTIKT